MSKVIKSTRGRKSSLGPCTRVNFYLPDSTRKEIRELKERAKKISPSLKYSEAFLLREGLKLVLRRENKVLEDAEKGEFHAKRRKGVDQLKPFFRKRKRRNI